MTTLKIKPLSVNRAWQGHRFKSPDYEAYERAVYYQLPDLKIPEGPLKLFLEFGVSNAGFDWDNGIKPLVDILQKKYNFNDNRIYSAFINKVQVKKGNEYVLFHLQRLNE